MQESLGILTCLSVIFFYFFAGRIIASHTVFGRNFAASSLHSLFSALGIWYLFALAATILEIKLNIAWWTFTGFIVASYFYFLSSRHEKLPREHSITIPLMILIFLSPTLYFVMGDVPINLVEFTTYLRNASYITTQVSMPDSNAGLAYALENVTKPQGNALALLPSFIISSGFSESYFAIFNVILLAFITDGMTKLTNIKVRWSNIGLVTAGSIFALTVLNPFFSLSSLTSSTPDFLFAAAILAAITPICREKQLPTGLAAIPTAFILATLVSIHSMGVYAVICILSLWFLRTLFESKTFVNSFFSITVLIAIPALLWHLWAYHVQGIELNRILNNISSIDIFHIVRNQFNPFALILLITTIILLLVEIISIRSYREFKNLFTQNSWLTMPTIFTFTYIFIAISKGESAYISHIQFIAIIPIWYFMSSWYKNSKWQKFAYESPWAIALSIAVVFMSLQSIASNQTRQRYTDPIKHTLYVASTLKNETLIADENIATLENNEKSKYASIMRYGLSEHKGKIANANKLLAASVSNAKLFHFKLIENKFNYLWIHSPTEQDKNWLGRFLKTDRSYLFKVTKDSLRLVKIYAHPSYDYKSL